MKSLEHIIREIREGKAEKGNKKSLEGAIRNVMKGEKESSFADRTTKPITDDVGGLIGSGTGGEPKLHKEAVGVIGTDDYQGNQFKSVRTQTPHIKPPAGAGSHSQAPENVSRQRTLAKEKSSMTLHGKVSEATKYAEPKPDIKIAPLAPEPSKSTSLTTTTKKPVATVSKTMPTLGRYASEIGKFVAGKAATTLGLVLDPDFGGLLPSKGETKSEFERQKEQAAKTATAKPVKLPDIDIKAAAPKPTEVKPEPKVVSPVPQEMPKLEPKVDIPAPTKSEPKEPKKEPSLSAGGASIPHEIDYTASHLVRPKVGVGHAKMHKKHAMKESEERKTIENMPRKGDRKSIEYVGRSSSDPKTTREKTSRLAIIKNVIDEAKKQVAKKTSYEDGKPKMFDYGDDVLIINPNQKRIDLDTEGNKLPKDYDNK
jgi:hypothetical protein